MFSGWDLRLQRLEARVKVREIALFYRGRPYGDRPREAGVSGANISYIEGLDAVPDATAKAYLAALAAAIKGREGQP